LGSFRKKFGKGDQRAEDHYGLEMDGADDLFEYVGFCFGDFGALFSDFAFKFGPQFKHVAF